MPGISDTAYPRLKSNPSAKELDEVYTPNIVELVYAEKRTREPVPRVGFLLLLKTFQRLGYFVRFHEIPTPVVEHVARCTGYDEIPSGLVDYDANSVRRRHMVLVREFVGVRVWDEAGERVMEQACEEAARTRDDLADIINAGIEELVRQRHELPAFSTLLRAAQTARAQVNRRYHAQVCAALGHIATTNIQALLTRPAYETQSQWDQLKSEPKQPTVRHTKDFLDHLDWLRGPNILAEIFAGIPDVKVKQFAAEARSLDLSSVNDLTEQKKLTVTAALVVMQIARTLDDVADMFIRLVQKLHNEAYDALLQHQTEQVERTDSLVNTLREVTLAYRTEGTAEQRLAAIGEWIEPEADHILTMCEEHESTAGHNYLPFLIRFYSNQSLLLSLFRM